MQETVDLTASIVTYKTPLKDLDKSINDLRSSLTSLFIVIVDNDYGESYFNQLKDRFNNFQNVKIVSSGKNAGYGHGHNFAMKNIPLSKYHLVLNADIEIEKESAQKIFKFIKNREDVGLVVPKILNPDGSLQALNKRNPTIVDMFLRFVSGVLGRFKIVQKRLAYYEMHDLGYDSEIDVPYASGCFMLFRRKILESIGGFDDNFFMYLEDADITRRVAEVSRSVFYPDARIVHNWSRGGHKSIKLILVTLHSMGIYFRKWGWRVF